MINRLQEGSNKKRKYTNKVRPSVLYDRELEESDEVFNEFVGGARSGVG